jgi:sialidase-1
MLNTRNQQGDKRSRIIAISNNGGTKWDTVYFDANLPDPVCQGSLLNIGMYKNKEMLAFSNAADSKNRNNLTLRISKDDGHTWIQNILVDKTEDEKQISDYTAYSDIVLVTKKSIGVIYEKENYNKIVFTIIKWGK